MIEYDDTDQTQDPDFWTKDHYPEKQPSQEIPFPCYPDREPTPARHQFQQVKSKNLSTYSRANGAETLFVKNSLILLSGLPKSGKTTLAVALADAIVKGKPFAGFRLPKTAVGYVSFDDSPAEILAAIDRHDDLTEDSPFFLSIMNDPIDTRDGLEQIEDFLISQRGGVVIIDSLHAALTKSQTRDARQVRNLITPLKRVAERAGTIILIHHTDAHGKRAGDHTQIQAAVSQTVLMSTQENDGFRLIKLQCKGRGAGSYRKIHLLSRSETHYQPHNPNPTANLHAFDRSTKPIIEALFKGPKTVNELVELTNLSPQRIYKRIKHLVTHGYVLFSSARPRRFKIA
ncbi:MAG: AAA family ATPase [Fimbriimonas sp.]|nr:AAA family ATPase [Fimbriimonas sp.]